MDEGQTTQWPKEKGHTTIYKTLHRKLKIDQDDPTKKILYITVVLLL